MAEGGKEFPMENPGSHSANLQRWLDQLQQAGEAGFHQARNEIIRHVCDRLEMLTRRMLRTNPRLRRWEQTADVLQNALIRLHHALETVQPESVAQFYGLAATQIRRELIDLARHHFGPEGAAARHHTDGAAEQISDRPDSIPRKGDFAGEPATLAEWTEFHQKVEELPDAERQVFNLLWYEGLSQIEAAKILGVTDRTIKNRWRSAKLLLKNILDGEVLP
jgi:RNA polymerase sigma factor (sigma-70 family)